MDTTSSKNVPLVKAVKIDIAACHISGSSKRSDLIIPLHIAMGGYRGGGRPPPLELQDPD